MIMLGCVMSIMLCKAGYSMLCCIVSCCPQWFDILKSKADPNVGKLSRWRRFQKFRLNIIKYVRSYYRKGSACCPQVWAYQYDIIVPQWTIYFCRSLIDRYVSMDELFDLSSNQRQQTMAGKLFSERNQLQGMRS